MSIFDLTEEKREVSELKKELDRLNSLGLKGDISYCFMSHLDTQIQFEVAKMKLKTAINWNLSLVFSSVGVLISLVTLIISILSR